MRCFSTGSGRSGKSTIVKQMKIIHQNGYTRDELMAFRTAIYKNTLESAHHILLAMRKIGVDCVDSSNRVRPLSVPLCEDCQIHRSAQANADRILDYEVSPSPGFCFSREMAEAIYNLWKDPIIPTVMDHSSEFYLMSSAS